MSRPILLLRCATLQLRAILYGLLASLTLILFASLAHAQSSSVLFLSPDSSWKTCGSFLDLSGNGQIGSNFLDIEFFQKSFFGGFITQEHIAKMESNAREFNRFGFAASGALEYYNFKDTVFSNPHVGIKIGLTSSYHASLSFTKDLFKTIYQGNAQFAGKGRANVAPMVLNYQAWQKFGLGFFDKRTLSSINLSLVAGDQFASLVANKGSLHTSPSGEEIALDYAGQLWLSDSLKRGWANGSGLGVALDANYNLPIGERKGVISIAFKDIGFVSWGKQSRRIDFDSTLTWTGYQVDNLFEWNTDSLAFPVLQDSIQKTTTRGSYMAALPMSIHLRYAHVISGKWFYDLGVSIWPNRAAVPMTSAALGYFVQPGLALTARVGYGGYGKWMSGLECQWLPKSKWLITARVNNLGGWISPAARSRDITFSIGKFLYPKIDKTDSEKRI